MAYDITEAKKIVVEAGKRLVESGLIARTWGNISARISDTQFAITPSGLAYETLNEEDIVVVSIADCSYEGNVKPSSEKGVHAVAYQLRPDVDFIIHTHQELASVLSITGENLLVSQKTFQDTLGLLVPCAPYGISSTKKLKIQVESTLIRYPECKALLMKHHGTLCMGYNLEHTFEIAKSLEALAEEEIKKIKSGFEEEQQEFVDYGFSEREQDSFWLKRNGEKTKYSLTNFIAKEDPIANLHASIYKETDMHCILHTMVPEIVEVSKKGKTLPPYTDDLAQIAGINVPVVDAKINAHKKIEGVLKHRNAVLLLNQGALCTGKSTSDAIAVEMILKKGCAADLYADKKEGKFFIGFLDAFLQRTVYVLKYSKQKK